MHLARIGRGEGARLILTGRGGDEWLTVTPYCWPTTRRVATSRGSGACWQMWRRAHRAGPRELSRLLWTTAGPPAGECCAGHVAHRHRGTRTAAGGCSRSDPAWVAPEPCDPCGDGSARRPMDGGREAAPGFYSVKCGRPCSIRASRTTWRRRRNSAAGTASACSTRSGTWIVVNALYSVPPDLLMKDGRSKWLLRRRLAARLPGLGLERRVKVSARSGVPAA